MQFVLFSSQLLIVFFLKIGMYDEIDDIEISHPRLGMLATTPSPLTKILTRLSLKSLVTGEPSGMILTSMLESSARMIFCASFPESPTVSGQSFLSDISKAIINHQNQKGINIIQHLNTMNLPFHLFEGIDRYSTLNGTIKIFEKKCRSYINNLIENDLRLIIQRDFPLDRVNYNSLLCFQIFPIFPCYSPEKKIFNLFLSKNQRTQHPSQKYKTLVEKPKISQQSMDQTKLTAFSRSSTKIDNLSEYIRKSKDQIKQQCCDD